MTAMPDRAMFEQQVVHLDLGPDVDAARRLVDDQHLGPKRQPARQHDFLLVAAGQVDHDLLRARHADVERAADSRSTSFLSAALVNEERPARKLIERGHR